MVSTRKGETYSNTIILLSAGKSRKRSLPINLVNNLLDDQIKTINIFDYKADIINVIGYRASNVLETVFHCRQIENIAFETTGPAESLRLALNASKVSHLFIINGDVNFNTKALRALESNNINIPLSGTEISTKRGISSENGKLLHLSFGLPNTWGEALYIPAPYYYWFKKEMQKINKNFTLADIINFINLHTPVDVTSSPKAEFNEIK